MGSVTEGREVKVRSYKKLKLDLESTGISTKEMKTDVHTTCEIFSMSFSTKAGNNSNVHLLVNTLNKNGVSYKCNIARLSITLFHYKVDEMP